MSALRIGWFGTGGASAKGEPAPSRPTDLARSLTPLTLGLSSAACFGKPEHEQLLCTLRCLSAKCYDEVYGPPAEELEEGEIDRPRDNSFNRCVKQEARSW